MESTKTISRTAFHGLFLIILAALVGIAGMVEGGLRRVLGWEWPNTPVSLFLVVPIAFLARAGLDGTLRRLGLSRSGTSLEVRTRPAADPVEPWPLDEVCVEFAEQSRRASLVLGLLLAMLGLVALNARVDAGARLICGVAGVGGLAVIVLIGATWDLPLARVDAEGIAVRQGSCSLAPRFVPWSRIATCEIQTRYDTFGHEAAVRPVLKDAEGRLLLDLTLPGIAPVDRDRLLKAVRARLPKPRFEPWEEFRP